MAARNVNSNAVAPGQRINVLGRTLLCVKQKPALFGKCTGCDLQKPIFGEEWERDRAICHLLDCESDRREDGLDVIFKDAETKQ